MPELPEVETTIRYLDKKVNGKKILSINKSSKNLRKNLHIKEFKLIEGGIIKEVKRIAKYIVVKLNTSRYLIIHLGMSGRLKFHTKDKFKKEKHDHIFLEFQKFYIVFNDPRRFGMFFFLKNLEEVNIFFDKYGFDLLTSSIDISHIFKIFQKKSVSLKQVLLDQRVFVGIGNIYANEALFHCRLDPQRLTNTLTKKQVEKLIQSCRHVLELSLKNGGSSINDYKSPDGTLGSFQNMFEVYQRKKVIWKNRTFLVKKIIQNGRSTFFSPTLQK